MKVSYITGCVHNDLVIDDTCVSTTSTYDKKWIELIKHVYDKIFNVLTLEVNDICDFLFPVINSRFIKHELKENIIYCHEYIFHMHDNVGILSITKNNKTVVPSVEVCKKMVCYLINDTVEEKDDERDRQMCLFLSDQIKVLLYTYLPSITLYECGQCGDSVYEYSLEI